MPSYFIKVGNFIRNCKENKQSYRRQKSKPNSDNDTFIARYPLTITYSDAYNAKMYQ